MTDKVLKHKQHGKSCVEVPNHLSPTRVHHSKQSSTHAPHSFKLYKRPTQPNVLFLIRHSKVGSFISLFILKRQWRVCRRIIRGNSFILCKICSLVPSPIDLQAVQEPSIILGPAAQRLWRCGKLGGGGGEGGERRKIPDTRSSFWLPAEEAAFQNLHKKVSRSDTWTESITFNLI